MPTVSPAPRYRAHYAEIIVSDPYRDGGRPYIRDTHIAVADVLAYLGHGLSAARLLADFPELTREDIRACLCYAIVQAKSDAPDAAILPAPRADMGQ